MAITNLVSIMRGTSAQLTEWDETSIAIDVEEAASMDMQWDKLIKFHDYREAGMTRTLTQVDSVTMSVKTADTTDGYQPNPVALNSNGRNTTVTAKVVDIILAIDALIAGKTNSRQVAVETMGAAYNDRRNADVMANYSDFATQYQLANATYESVFVAAISKLQTNKVKGRISLVVPSSQTDQIYSIPQFAKAQDYGRSILAEVGDITMAYMGLAPMNVAFWHCPDYTASGGYDWGMMFSQRALEYEEKLPMTIGIDDSQLFTGRRGLLMGATTFYSVTGTRESAGTAKWGVGIGFATE